MGTETTRYRIVLDDRLTPGIRKATASTRTFDNSLKRSNRSAKSLGTTLGKTFGVAGLVLGIFQTGKAIITLGKNIEQTRVAYGTFLGDVERGNALVNKLREFAKVTPFETSKVLAAGQTLLGFGLQSESILPTMSMLGDISAGTGKDLKELAVIYGQVRGAGRLMGQDALQLINAGFNPLQHISEKTGRSMLDLKKDMEAGLISFEMVEKAFIEATSAGGRFFMLSEKQSKTLGGRWSTLVGTLQDLGASIGEGFNDGLASAVHGLNDFIVDAQPSIMAMIDTISIGFSGLGNSITTSLNDLGKAFGLEGSLFSDLLGFVTFASSAIVSTIGLAVDSIKSLIITAEGALQYLGGNRALGKAMMKTGGYDKAGLAVNNYLADLSNALVESFGIGETATESGIGAAPQTKGLVRGMGANAKSFQSSGQSSSSSESGKKGGISGIQSKVRNITINIEKMVEEINFNNITGGQSEAELVETVKRALLTAVNDANVIAR